MSHQTVINHLKKIGFKKKLDVWVPHDLTQKNIFARMDGCESLLNRNKIDPFLKRMVTGDEKWVTYDNVKRKPVVVEKRSGCPDGGQAWIDGQEGSSVCLVGLAGNHPL